MMHVGQSVKYLGSKSCQHQLRIKTNNKSKLIEF